MSNAETQWDDQTGAQTRILLLAIRTSDTTGVLERVRAVLPAETEIRVEPAADASLPLLTTRQNDILTLMLRNLSNKEIGRILDISHFTVRNHVSQLLRLLSFSSRKAAIAALSARLSEFRYAPHPAMARSLPDKTRSDVCR